MAKTFVLFTFLVIGCLIKTNSAAPFFWNLLFPTTTTSSVTTASTSLNSGANNSETYNNGNNNLYSIPISASQTGSTVDGSAVSTLDQFIGDISLNVSKRSIGIPPFIEPFVPQVLV